MVLMGMMWLGYYCGCRSWMNATMVKKDTIILRDTVIRHDTVRIVRPEVKQVMLIKHDTVRLLTTAHDTVAALVPMERKVYQDSTYRAVVSGFRPSLDSLSIFKKERTITVEKNISLKPTKWSVELQGGYGITPKGMQPYIGIGVGLRF